MSGLPREGAEKAAGKEGMARTPKDMPPAAMQDKPEAPRSIYGPRPLGALLAPLLRPTFRKRAPATAQILADWPSIVGPRLAEVTTPRRLAAGTLTLACAGPVALELQHMAGALAERINTHLGRRAVERLRFVQDLLAPMACPPPRPPPDPTVAARLAARLADFPHAELRNALDALGRAVYAAGRRR